MIEVKLGSRYAKSIIGLAEEKGLMDQVNEDFKLIESVCNSNPDFLNLLKSPIIPGDKKGKIVKAVFGGKLTEMTDKLIEIIIRKKREPWLLDIAIRYTELYNIAQNITTGKIISSQPLSDSQKQKIQDVVEKQLGTTFQLEEEIDPTLIGGFILRVGDKLFDGSVSYLLNKLGQEFEKNPYIKA